MSWWLAIIAFVWALFLWLCFLQLVSFLFHGSSTQKANSKQQQPATFIGGILLAFGTYLAIKDVRDFLKGDK